jgi:predicted nucleic acid-binding protein
MTGEVLVDSNVLVYAYDRSEPEKQRSAVALLDRMVAAGVGVLTTQVMAEFFVSVTRKIAAPLDIPVAAERVRNYVLSWPIVDVTSMVVLEATRGVSDHQLHFWDAQLWAAARLNQIDVLFTEDLPSGASIDGVRFVNPFAPGFMIEDWV